MPSRVPYPGQLTFNVIDILGIVLENCMQHLLLLIKTKFQRAMIDQLRALIGRQLCSEV